MRSLGRCLGRLIFGFVFASFVISALIPYPAWATPMVAITRPSNGATVSAELWIDAVYQSSSQVPIVRLELLVDGALVHKYVLPAPRVQGQQSFSYKLDATVDRLHTISVRAIDQSGAMGQATISVSVKKASAPPSADRTPPIVNIYYPTDGQQVSGTCEIKVDARDDTAVEWVFIYVDNKPKALIKGNPPYIDRWDTTKTTDGEHVIHATALDRAENEGRSAEIRVVVANRKRTGLRTAAPATGSAAATPQSALAPGAEAGGPATAPSTPPTVPEPLPLPSSLPGASVSTSAPGAASPAASPLTPAAGPEGGRTSAASAAATGRAAPREVGPRAVDLPARQPASRMARVPAASGTRGTVLPMAITSVARPWSATSGAAAVCQTLPVGRFVELAGATPGRVLVMRQHYVGATARTASASTAPLSARPVQDHARTPAGASLGAAYAMRIASPVGTAVRTLALPAVQAAPVIPRVAAKAAAGACSVQVRSNRPVLPPAPPRTAASLPAVRAGYAKASASVAAKTSGQPAATTAPSKPSSRAGLASRERAAGGASEAACGLAPVQARAARVYLLAMLPRTAGHGTGVGVPSQARAVVEADARVSVAPAALARLRDVKVVYDGKLVPLRACPEVKGGVPVGPLREVFEQSDGVLYWFPVEKRVRAVSPQAEVELRIGVPVAKVNGVTERLELAPYIKRGRTMVPLSFIAATLNVTITFDSKRGQLIISRNDM